MVNALWCALRGDVRDAMTGAPIEKAHVRVGFEDSPSLPDDPQPDSNARFVEWAVRLSRSLGREPLSPAEARPLLGLL